jgi:hypothetical protein
MRTYPSVTYPDVWDINLELANIDLTNKTSNSQIVKLRVVYVYLDKTTGKYKPNKNR